MLFNDKDAISDPSMAYNSYGQIMFKWSYFWIGLIMNNRTGRFGNNIYDEILFEVQMKCVLVFSIEFIYQDRRLNLIKEK